MLSIHGILVIQNPLLSNKTIVDRGYSRIWWRRRCDLFDKCAWFKCKNGRSVSDVSQPEGVTPIWNNRQLYYEAGNYYRCVQILCSEYQDYVARLWLARKCQKGEYHVIVGLHILMMWELWEYILCSSSLRFDWIDVLLYCFTLRYVSRGVWDTDFPETSQFKQNISSHLGVRPDLIQPACDTSPSLSQCHVSTESGIANVRSRYSPFAAMSTLRIVHSLSCLSR